MTFTGFRKLNNEETKNINGGWTCPKTVAAFQKKLKSLSYADQKRYIKWIYEKPCPTPSK